MLPFTFSFYFFIILVNPTGISAWWVFEEIGESDSSDPVSPSVDNSEKDLAEIENFSGNEDEFSDDEDFFTGSLVEDLDPKSAPDDNLYYPYEPEEKKKTRNNRKDPFMIPRSLLHLIRAVEEETPGKPLVPYDHPEEDTTQSDAATESYTQITTSAVASDSEVTEDFLKEESPTPSEEEKEPAQKVEISSTQVVEITGMQGSSEQSVTATSPYQDIFWDSLGANDDQVHNEETTTSLIRLLDEDGAETPTPEWSPELQDESNRYLNAGNDSDDPIDVKGGQETTLNPQPLLDEDLQTPTTLAQQEEQKSTEQGWIDIKETTATSDPQSLLDEDDLHTSSPTSYTKQEDEQNLAALGSPDDFDGAWGASETTVSFAPPPPPLLLDENKNQTSEPDASPQTSEHIIRFLDSTDELGEYLDADNNFQMTTSLDTILDDDNVISPTSSPDLTTQQEEQSLRSMESPNGLEEDLNLSNAETATSSLPLLREEGTQTPSLQLSSASEENQKSDESQNRLEETTVDSGEKEVTTEGLHITDEDVQTPTEKDGEVWEDESTNDQSTNGLQRSGNDNISSSLPLVEKTTSPQTQDEDEDEIDARSFLSQGSQKEEAPFNRCKASPYPCQVGQRCLWLSGKVQCVMYSPPVVTRAPQLSCQSHPCMNGGTCLEQTTSYRCVCPPGIAGRNCELTGACYPNPCHGNCKCVESCRHELGYYCESNAGYTGKNCTIPLPRLICGPSDITLDISRTFLEDFDRRMGSSHLYVSPQSDIFHKRAQLCQAQTMDRGLQVRIPLPFDSCGTSRTRSSGVDTEVTLIKNRVWLDRYNSVFDMSMPVLDFECKYEREYSLVTSLQPIVETTEIISGTGSLSPKSHLCKVDACPSQCPPQYAVSGEAAYTVGEIIHLSITADSKGGFGDLVTSVEQLYLSCGSAQGARELLLVQNGCPTQSGIYVRARPGAHSCVSFQVPLFRSCSFVYVHAHLKLCARHTLQVCRSNSNFQKCSTSLARRRRTTRNEYDSEEVMSVIGPLLILNGSEGRENVHLFRGSNPALVDVERSHIGKNRAPNDPPKIAKVSPSQLANGKQGMRINYMIALGTLLILLTVIFILGLVYSLCKSERPRRLVSQRNNT